MGIIWPDTFLANSGTDLDNPGNSNFYWFLCAEYTGEDLPGTPHLNGQSSYKQIMQIVWSKLQKCTGDHSVDIEEGLFDSSKIALSPPWCKVSLPHVLFMSPTCESFSEKKDHRY